MCINTIEKLAIAFLVCITFCVCQEFPFDSSSLKEDKVTCCICVPFYACVDGKIDIEKLSSGNESRQELISNVNKCPHHLDFCCKITDDNGHQCRNLGQIPPVISYEPRPNTFCNCMSYQFCPLQSVIMDGKGKTSAILTNIGLPSHSKCDSAVGHVCCESENFIVVNGIPKDQACTCVKKHCCSENVYTYGDGLLQPRVEDEEVFPTCVNDTVCCPPSEITNSTRCSSTIVYSNLSLVLYTSLICSFIINYYK